jgi:hypothetical protein
MLQPRILVVLALAAAGGLLAAIPWFLPTARAQPVFEDCCNFLDDDEDGKIDLADEDCATAPDCIPLFVRGDANLDFRLNIADPIFILSFLFAGGPARDCKDAMDLDDDGEVDVSDAIALLGYLFLRGVPPAPPFPACGQDSAEDDGMRCRAPECRSPLPWRP